MARARETLISLTDTPYYHCIGRCVRRAFLCGEDRFTGKDYSHRKQWIVDKLAELSSVFLIDVCAYAVMSNHYHVVLRVNHEVIDKLSDEEVIERWTTLFTMPLIIQNHLKKENKDEYEFEKVKEIITQWRERLADISWFMRCLNESIARQANKEDNCTGRFWEGRFKSQALLNEQAVLSCMAYVDLNPIRAGLANSLDESDFTSISQRINEFSLRQQDEGNELKEQADKENKKVKLSDFIGGQDREGIPYTFMDYLELVDWTGRAIRDDKVDCIDKSEPKILDKLGFTSEIWFKAVSLYSNSNYLYFGTDDQLKSICEDREQKWIAGSKVCRELYVN